MACQVGEGDQPQPIEIGKHRVVGVVASLACVATQALERGELGAAERHLERVVSLEPLRESAQRALMQTLAVGGNYAAATQVYRELRLRLHRELKAAFDPAGILNPGRLYPEL